MYQSHDDIGAFVGTPVLHGGCWVHSATFKSMQRRQSAPLGRPFRRGRNVRWTCSLPLALQDLADGLNRKSDATARYMHLVGLGDALDQIARKDLVSTTRVPGCTSVTHIEVVVHDDAKVSLRGFSDARISRGIVALLVHGLNGSDAEEVLSVTAEELLMRSGLQGTVSLTRVTGLSAILREIQRRVREQLNGTRRRQEAETPFWTEGGGADTAVLLSGGVDSSVALRLAQAAGARVEAFYLKIWLGDELAHLGKCAWEDDISTAREVCAQAGVRLHEVPLQHEYWDRVVSYTMAEARAGRTPNPDVMCNSRIKFGAFLESVPDHERVVTGHYAQVRTANDGRAELWTSPDAVKDQTYFLAQLSQAQVKRAWMPIGGLQKTDVRQLAREMELPNEARRESQGLCFLGKVRFEDFLRSALGEERGRLVEFESGRQLGWHRGYWFFTVGQRRGVGLSGGPWYVVCKNIDDNIVFVSRAYDAAEQARNEFEFEAASWIAGAWPAGWGVGEQRALRVKTRHGSYFHDAVVERGEGMCGRVKLSVRDKGLASGQFAAFYDEAGRCLGSAVIAADSSLQPPPGKIIPPTKASVRLQAHFKPAMLASSPTHTLTSADRPVTRARKRARLSPAPPRKQTTPKTAKRRYDEPEPHSLRKRRPITPLAPPPAKRPRLQNNSDVPMVDPSPARRPPPHRTLKDVLRAHRLGHAILNRPLARIPSSRGAKEEATARAVMPPPPRVTAMPASAPSECSYVDHAERVERADFDDQLPVHLTGNEHIEAIDISEITDLPQESESTPASEETPLQAQLLDNGKCIVRIVRPDGAIDYYALDPLQRS